MPLIRCLDCGKDVSSLAPACPGCGRPMLAPAPAPEEALATPGGAPPGGAAERTLWEGRPSPMLAILRASLRAGIALAVAPGAICAAHAFAFSDRNPALRDMLGWYRIANQQVPMLWVAIALCAVIMVIWSARVLHALRASFGEYFRVTTQRIVCQKGIISTDVDEIDLRVIDDVLLHQTVMQRLFGLGQIDVLSSDRSASRMVLRDVKRASQLRELIRTHVYAVSQRQLFTRPA